MGQTVNDIRARMAAAINEAKQPTKKATQEFWLNGFKKFMNSKDHASVSSRKGDTGEVLRANFGANDGTAESKIVEFLDKIGKLNQRNYDIEMLPVGVISNDYNAYKITFNRPDKDDLGRFYKKGDFFIITNRYKIGKDGAASVINRKDLTPDALGITKGEYKSANALMSVVKPAIYALGYPGQYIDFIIKSSDEVINDSKNRGSFANFQAYANSAIKEITYNISNELFEGIDQLSINNFQNDYGEILGGFAVFNLLKDYGSGLSYPTASNEKLVDFYFDGYSVSSKAGGGGTPSGDTIIQKINELRNKGVIQPEGTNEVEFFTNVVDIWIKPLKLDRSTIYNTVMNLSAVNITDKNNSGYWYLSEKTGFGPTQMERVSVEKFLDDLYEKDVNEFSNLLAELWTRAGLEWNDKKLKEYVDLYPTMNKFRIGVVFYPIMVEIKGILNDLYQGELTKFGQMATDVKQLYLDVKVKQGLFVFKIVPFKTAQFKFEQKGSIPNPFNANLGIKILK